ARVIEEHAVAYLHLVPHEVARLVVAHPRPRRAASFGGEHVVDRALVGLRLHQPIAHFLEKESPPQMPVGSAPEPWLNRVVAFRSHQVRPARMRGTITTVTLSPQPKEAIGSEKLSPVAHRRGPASF